MSGPDATPPESGATRPGSEESRRILDYLHAHRDQFVDFLSRLTILESPTDRPETQAPVHDLLGGALAELGYHVRILAGRGTGGHLYARPARRTRGLPSQLLVGHTDTVWPVGTLARMPLHETDGRLHGPGTLDMKGGLAQIVFALRALEAAGLEPTVTPVVFVNSDEEIGSPDSKRYVARISRRVCRAFVVEPALAPDARLKTARKGIARFEVTIQGRASHAGLDPDAGASAVTELAHVIQSLHALNDRDRGTTVNVGVVAGGTRANVVAALATASVDARVRTMADAAELERDVAGIRAVTPGVVLEISGGLVVPPLERTPRNRLLWEMARVASRDLGFEIDEGTAGGGSDGNTTSLFTATLDGLGCVGDGPHALHEHVEIDASLERCALLARLLLAPAGP